MEVAFVEKAIQKLQAETLRLIQNFEESTGTCIVEQRLFFKTDEQGRKRTSEVIYGALVQAVAPKEEK